MKFYDLHTKLNEDEYSKALALYTDIRNDDKRLAAVEDEAISIIQKITGYVAIDVGSFGLQLNLEGSDLDIAIGVPKLDESRVLNALTEKFKYKGKRRTSTTTERHLFGFFVRGVEIDVGVLPDSDFHDLSAALQNYHREITLEEKVTHVWHKYQLKVAGKKQEYAKLKLYPYARFCPEFEWVPILE
jgi:hypothetical protein